MKKVLIAALAILLISVQSVAACTVFSVGKNATVDGSTMISHTCDSNSDDLRLWIIPSMEAGSKRDVVVDGRLNADYSNFPKVKDYGTNGMVLDSYVNKKATNQYIHAMYSFMNDKGLAISESTCSCKWTKTATHQANIKKISAALSKDEGIWDAYMLLDATLESCSTAREAVQFMGQKVENDGWYGMAECMCICDGTEAWVFEVYGGKIWCALRVPDNAIFIAANRARIDYLIENDPANCLYAKNIKSFAIENNLWDGKGEFHPNNTYAPDKEDNMGSGLREWRIISLLNPTLYGNLDPWGDLDDYPLFVVPEKKISVATIHSICSDYYAGTEFDISKTIDAGAFGNVLSSYNNNLKKASKQGVARPINMFRCTYIQIANVRADLPEEARCLTWFGWGAPSCTYLTPIFASQTSLAEHFGIGMRNEFNENSGWWNESQVQQLATINYRDAIKIIKEVRDQKMADVYKETAATQEIAGILIENGMKDLAVNYLTTYATGVAEDWFDTYSDLADTLRGRLAIDCLDMNTPSRSSWWKNLVVSDMLNNPQP